MDLKGIIETGIVIILILLIFYAPIEHMVRYLWTL